MRPAIVEELPASVTPWAALQRLADLPHAIFLDSAARNSPLGRYSYVAADPFEVVSCRRGRASLRRKLGDTLGGAYTEIDDCARDPFVLLAERRTTCSQTKIDDIPPFQGGCAGLFGYGLARSLERLPRPRWDEFDLPEMVVGIYDWVLSFDHVNETAFLVVSGLPHHDPAARERRAQRRAEEVRQRLKLDVVETTAGTRSEENLPFDKLSPCHPVRGSKEFFSNFAHSEYLRAVEQAIEYIRAGDIFQVNLSQRLLHPARWPALELYRRLRASNPAPFAGYFDTGSEIVASSSPEQFLAVDGREIVTRPIKGTYPRGYTPMADIYGREVLLQSDKDRAENVMIVDLLRNDISRVAKPHSVKVPQLFELEHHPTVHHLVSEVRGTLADGLDAVDLLRATFPGGSITGAPKIRAMEIIAELEPTARGPYCGGLGWIGCNEDMNLNILIRTMTLSKGWIQFPAGGGIVADSDPEAEYRETLAKAEGMARALLG